MLLSLSCNLGNLIVSCYFVRLLIDKSRSLINDPLLKVETKDFKLKQYKVLYLDYNDYKISQFYYSYVLIARYTAFVFVLMMIPGSPTV
jgi:hypothetical protein